MCPFRDTVKNNRLRLGEVAWRNTVSYTHLLIYYPKEKMDLVKDTEEDMENWYKITLYRLIEICKTTASKYTRSKVRKALPTDYALSLIHISIFLQRYQRE